MQKGEKFFRFENQAVPFITVVRQLKNGNMVINPDSINRYMELVNQEKKDLQREIKSKKRSNFTLRVIVVALLAVLFFLVA